MTVLRRLLLGMMLATTAGCMHAASPARLRVAQAEPHICKHCHCYMPAGVANTAPCTVCDCKYLAGQCHRGA